MNAIIKLIQESLLYGHPLEVKTGPLAAQVIKVMQKSDLEEKTESKKKKIS